MREISLRDNRFFVHDNEDLSNAIVRNGDFWEADILEYIEEFYFTHKVILDIGANIGNHTVYFAEYLGFSQILAFEPDGENFKLLAKNTAPYDRVISYNIALSNKNGSLYLQKNGSNWGAHEVHDEYFKDVVGCMRLDSFDLENVTLMKIDVEWHEPQVLEGARETIKRCKPLILIEDTNDEYGNLPELKDYQLIKRWAHHNTSLYAWREP